MFNIKALNKIATAGTEILTNCGYTVESDIDNAEAILVRSADMHSYEYNEELLAIARAGAGTNNIPLADCAEHGIVVFNTPGANAEAVKELALCAILIASRDVIGGANWAKSLDGNGADIGKIVEKGKSKFAGPEIMGKTLGVIGLGAVGAKIANAAIDLGMNVYGYDPFLSVDAAWKLSRAANHATDMDTIFANCDYITIHVPYMKDTHHTIDAAAIEKMRDGVRIINLARGELIDDDAMKVALESGKVACYVTDFPNEKTVTYPNAITLPHIGASTPESEDKCAVMAAQELIDYLENGNITNSVNMPNVKLKRIGEARLCVIHRNVPKVISTILDYIADQNINVERMMNKPRGDYAYTIINLSAKITDEAKQNIEAMDDVLRVRVIV